MNSLEVKTCIKRQDVLITYNCDIHHLSMSLKLQVNNFIYPDVTKRKFYKFSSDTKIALELHDEQK